MSSSVCRCQRTTCGVGSLLLPLHGFQASNSAPDLGGKYLYLLSYLSSPVCYQYFLVSYLILCVLVVCPNICLCEDVGSPRELQTVMNCLPYGCWLLNLRPLYLQPHLFFYFLGSATDQNQNLHTYILNKLFPQSYTPVQSFPSNCLHFQLLSKYFDMSVPIEKVFV